MTRIFLRRGAGGGTAAAPPPLGGPVGACIPAGRPAEPSRRDGHVKDMRGESLVRGEGVVRGEIGGARGGGFGSRCGCESRGGC